MAALWRGYSIYRTPKGTEVKVTVVTESSTDSGTKWNDIRYVGEVTDWVRNESSWAYTYKSYGQRAMPPQQQPVVQQPATPPKSPPEIICRKKYYGIDCDCPKCKGK